MLVAATNTGKSFLLNQWLENIHKVFQKEPDEIVYVYEENTANREQIDRLSSKLNISFVEGFPKDSEQLITGTLFRQPRTKETHRLLILDDVYAQAVASKHMARFCTTYAHHHQTSLIITVQDVHDTSVRKNICAGTMLRNIGYMVLFPDIRYSALIRQLARMYFVGESDKIVEPFNIILKNRQKHMQDTQGARAYLVFNFLTSDPTLQITETGIFPSAEMHLFEKEESL
jgi:hypothetical protein